MEIVPLVGPLGTEGTLGAELGLTTMDKFLVAVAPPLSVTVIVKLEVPDEGGTPEITPVSLLSERPAGKLPCVTAQV